MMKYNYKYLREFRFSHKLTQQQFADALSLSTRHWNRIENNGEGGMITVKVLLKICNEFKDFDINQLFKVVDDEEGGE